MGRICIMFVAVLIPTLLVAFILSGLLINHGGVEESLPGLASAILPVALAAWIAGRRDGRRAGQMRSSGSCWLATLAMTGIWLLVLLAVIVTFTAIIIFNSSGDSAQLGSRVTTEFMFLGLGLVILALPVCLLIRIAFGIAHTRAVKAAQRKLLETF